MSNDDSGAMPGTVLLFSGHMIDAPGRKQPRFPADKESIARDAIVDTLTQAGAGPGDLAICGAACGGDLIFAEACLARGMGLNSISRLTSRPSWQIPSTSPMRIGTSASLRRRRRQRCM